MESRYRKIIALRGETLGTLTPQSSAEEIFQNQTLRPILKFQNDLFVQVFINYAVKQKNVFFDLSPEKKLVYIENVVQKDIKLRNLLKGMIVAFFTSEEYSVYIKNSSNLNKRMMNLLIERLRSQVQMLEK